MGSSRISTRASSDSALAISMSCWSAIARPRTGAVASIGHVEVREEGRRGPTHAAPVDGAESTHRRVAEEDVLRDRQVGEEPRFLVDDRDAQFARVGRTVDDHGLAVHRDRAFVRLMDAGQELHERALPGAVLADQRMHLARTQVERDVDERLGRAEPLRDGDQ